VRTRFADFVKNTSGATSIEYALLASGIAIMILAAVNLLGGAVNQNFTAVRDGLEAQRK